ncbi:uncharacterized protein LOC121392142 [Gigantopelta aegis]|uniref:uncharacterized protein LOC121392142 n=1 Tax=Gigantopelta aegis TaxID=1735272 RepID=UPI001B88BEC4|nr:uncharacterized protein LOC121392142 [Gigantopelta aegis]
MEDNHLYSMEGDASAHGEDSIMKENDIYNLETAEDREKVAVQPEDVSATYTVVNKDRKTADRNNTGEKEQPTGETYAVVRKKAAGVTKHKTTNGKSGDNEVLDDVSNMYTQVNKKKQKKQKKQKDIKQKGEAKSKTEGDGVEYVNIPSESSVYQNT